jgi:hypothetical protein
MRQKEIEEKQREDEHDRWFNQARPMIKVKGTSREKRLTREEGEDESTNSEDGYLEERQEKALMGEKGGEGQPGAHIMDVNVVFIIHEEFHALEKEVVTLALGAERAIFEKPIKMGKHMKPLFIRGYLDGAPMGRMLVDGGECEYNALDSVREVGT